jgi:hypothetical protein
MENQDANQPDNGEQGKSKYLWCTKFCLGCLIASIAMSIFATPEPPKGPTFLVVIAFFLFALGAFGGLGTSFEKGVSRELRVMVLIALGIAFLTNLNMCAMSMPM